MWLRINLTQITPFGATGQEWEVNFIATGDGGRGVPELRAACHSRALFGLPPGRELRTTWYVPVGRHLVPRDDRPRDPPERSCHLGACNGREEAVVLERCLGEGGVQTFEYVRKIFTRAISGFGDISIRRNRGILLSVVGARALRD